jgi:prepilin-type N-terminal cleavage/methylation domain-containing protein
MGFAHSIRPPLLGGSRSRRGFTLIEVLAGMLLFSIGVMGVIGVVLYGQRSAVLAQSDSTAFPTAMAVLRDPLPLGGVTDPATGAMTGWTWSQSGQTWTASDGSALPVWSATVWPIDQPGDLLVPDMAEPIANNPAVFSPGGGAPSAGCAHGWLNGYYVERREQSRASDRIGAGVRVVEVRVDVYWAAYGGDGRPLASVVDRVVRQGGP